MLYGSATAFAYHKKSKWEVEELIAALPILLEVKFGSAVWSWFTDNACAEAQEFKWQNGVGLIAVKDDLEPRETLDEGVLENREEYDITAAFPNLSLLQSSGKNHFNDSQSMTTRDLAAIKDAQGWWPDDWWLFDSKDTLAVLAESATTITAELMLTNQTCSPLLRSFPRKNSTCFLPMRWILSRSRHPPLQGLLSLARQNRLPQQTSWRLNLFTKPPVITIAPGLLIWQLIGQQLHSQRPSPPLQVFSQWRNLVGYRQSEYQFDPRLQQEDLPQTPGISEQIQSFLPIAKPKGCCWHL